MELKEMREDHWNTLWRTTTGPKHYLQSHTTKKLGSAEAQRGNFKFALSIYNLFLQGSECDFFI